MVHRICVCTMGVHISMCVFRAGVKGCVLMVCVCVQGCSKGWGVGGVGRCSGWYEVVVGGGG